MYKEKFDTGDLENRVEELVFMELHKLIEDESNEFCRCDICLLDIAALVLNSVPSKYENNFVDKMEPSEDKTTKLEALRQKVVEKMPAAIQLVTDKPHH